MRPSESANDLLAALRSSVVPSEVPKGYYTKKQLAESLGVSTDAVKSILGKMKIETKMFRVTQGSVTRPVPHYRLAERGAP